MKYCVSNVCLHDGFFLTKIVKRLQKEFGIFAEKLHPEAALQKYSFGKGVLKIYSKFALHPCQSVISIKLLCDRKCHRKTAPIIDKALGLNYHNFIDFFSVIILKK